MTPRTVEAGRSGGIGKPTGPPATVEEALAMVRAAGGRATASRRILLEILFGSEGHLSAEELGRQVQARAPEVHLSTIYRNLDELQRLGILSHSHIGHGAASYLLASLAHAHFICAECGVTIEAPDDVFNGLARTARARLGFEIDPRHFAMMGRCASCASGAGSGDVAAAGPLSGSGGGGDGGGDARGPGR